MTWRLALHEWRRTRSGLLFWLLLAIGQLLIAWLVFAQLEAFARIAPQLAANEAGLGVMELVIVPTLGSLVLLLILALPLLSHGGFAGEQRGGRLPIWLGAPVSSGQLVLGKTLGGFLCLLPLALTSGATLALTGLGVSLDWQQLAVAGAMLLLFGLWLSGIVTGLSTLVEHPAAALALGYGVVLFLWLLDSFVAADAGWHWAALLPHLEPAFRGLLRGTDLVYFVATGGAAVMLGVYRIARRRGEL